MAMTKLRFTLFNFAILALGGTAHASGFLLNEFDGAAVGRGDAVTASDTDPSSIYYNVGGLAVAGGAGVMIGGSLIAPSASYTDTAGTKTTSNTSAQAVPGVFVSYRITDILAAGVGFYTPYGLAIDWPAGSSQAGVAQDVDLATFYITPAVGLNLNRFIPGLSVGGGVDIVPATLTLTQQVFFGQDTPGTVSLGDTATGIGGRAGVMYRPQFVPGLSIGAMWHSNVTEEFTGTVNVDSLPQYRQMLPGNGTTTTTLNLPESFSGGIAYRPIDKLEIEADVVWTEWSKLQSLNLVVPAPPSQSGTMTISSPQNYTNTTSVRAGAEYAFPAIGLAVRAGYIYDPTPVPSTTLTAILPDMNRNDVCLGASKWFGEYAAHLGLLFVLPSSRETSSDPYMPVLKGTFDLSAFVASLSVSGRFR
jgi:long-chain fatty acid transport protein